MAGKTFPGIGDLEDESLDPADAADSDATPAPSGPLYSGPTVVDDAKLEESLKKVRSLDAPLTEVTGDVDTARELVQSGAHQMPVFNPTKDGGRGTFIGHSVAEPLPQPPPAEKPYDDRLRGTLFGHMLHLPELNLPAPEEPSSRELTIVDRSAPTIAAVDVYHPEAAEPVAAAVPPAAEAFPRSDRYRSIPIEVESEAKNRTFMRVGIAAAAIAAVVGAAIIWMHTSTEEPDQPTRPAAAAQAPAPQPAPRAPAAPEVVPTAPAPPPTAARPPATDEPARPDDTLARPTRDSLRPPAERARTLSVRPATTPPAAVVTRPEHHRAAAAEGAQPPPAAKAKASKHSAAEEDPDGTLAPTIE